MFVVVEVVVVSRTVLVPEPAPLLALLGEEDLTVLDGVGVGVGVVVVVVVVLVVVVVRGVLLCCDTKFVKPVLDSPLPPNCVLVLLLLDSGLIGAESPIGI